MESSSYHCRLRNYVSHLADFGDRPVEGFDFFLLNAPRFPFMCPAFSFDGIQFGREQARVATTDVLTYNAAVIRRVISVACHMPDDIP
jgi:hypothetical protein